jgi:Ca2+-binding RTX toxin-like protein
MAITTVNTTADLVSALKSARDGDTIQLTTGTYSGVSLKGLSFANGVTITSQRLDAQAVITDMNLSEVKGLTFQDLEFAAKNADGLSYRVESSQNVAFVRLDVHGSLDNDPSNDGQAFLIRNSDYVTVRDSEFQQLFSAISHADDEHLTIAGNSFHDLHLDGVRGGGSSWITITDNTIRDFHRDPTAHADAIQFWTRNVTTPSHDILIANNVILRGDGQYAQGVFLGDESDIGYERVTITGNLVAGGAINGITVFNGRNIVVTDNIVQGFLDRNSTIRIEESTGLVANNTSSLVNIAKTNVAITSYGNTTVALADDDGAWALQLWQSRHTGSSGAPTGLSLTGDAGDNTLTGGDLADTLAGGAGADVLTGGGGNDVYVVDAKPKIVETADGGVDTVRSSISFTLQANVEHLDLTGTRGSTGNGNMMDNAITGNDAANLLAGRAGADTLSGGAGGDTLDGEAGADALIGGAGADRFAFGPGDGRDVIRDFGAGGEHDIIDVTALRAAGATSTLAQTGGDVTITFSTGEQIVVLDTLVAELRTHASGWVF